MQNNHKSRLLGVDTGGTFTDFVLLSDDGVRIHKALSTPKQPERAILDGIQALGLMDAARGGQLLVVHGSTVATNAALEKKGVRTAFVTNRGFADMLSIGRQTRRELYNLLPPLADAPVPAELCLETGGRIGADGSVVEELTARDIEQLREKINSLQPEAVAINLLFSFVDDRFEREIERALPKDIFVCRSSEVLPEYREYERGMATWLNAWLGPKVGGYLKRLGDALGDTPVAVMQSSGGTIDARQAERRAVNLLLSGPAGGLAAARHLGELCDQRQLITFDMGGTSTDVSLINGEIKLTGEGAIGPYPVAVPMVDMHTIGAGGGSVAYVDAGGLLRVGPTSAGADPGPACYGKGGRQATVTDANVVLGRLRPDAFLGGAMTLDAAAARLAIAGVAAPLNLGIEEAAAGIIALANDHMIRALRVISVQRGHAPADFTLCCFGGAGGLHVCALATAMGMQRVLIPANGGVFSAQGMLVAPRERQLSRTLATPLAGVDEEHARQLLDEMATQGRRELHREGARDEQIELAASLDLCYQGQSYTLNIPLQDWEHTTSHFHDRHEQRYGHRMQLPIMLMNLRLALRARAADIRLPTLPEGPPSAARDSVKLHGYGQPVPVFERETLSGGQVIDGPALIVEMTSTSLIDSDWRCRVDGLGNLQLSHL